MSFAADQKLALAAPLSSARVKGRNQGGRNVSYIEGWHAIAEANRIFGFDGWTRETVELKCVAEREREIGQAKNPGWGVSYSAKVRVTVFAGDSLVTREGCGAGHGIDRDLGQAHESALKEAETDAMKRALMTFGNPFGLALYDKEQANVADEPSAKDILITNTKQYAEKATDAAVLATWWNSDAEKAARRFVGLEGQEALELKELVMARLDKLKKQAPTKDEFGLKPVPDAPLPSDNAKSSKRLSQQVGILCADPVFQQFLIERNFISEKTEERSAAFVRTYCEVGSRAEITLGSRAATRWDLLHGSFLAWKIAA